MIPLLKDHEVIAPSHDDLDITKTIVPQDIDMIIHAAAYTDVTKAETDKEPAFMTNVIGTMNLALAYPHIPFILISTEYAFNPVNFYSDTKLLAEVVVKGLTFSHLVIRTLFKPNPFPWDKAFKDQYTQGDYVDVIAPLLVKEIERWDVTQSKYIYVGTGRKTMYKLAQRTKPKVKPMLVSDITDVVLPTDYQ